MNRLIPWLALAAVLGIGYCRDVQHAGRQAALRIELDSARAREGRAVAQSRRLDTVYVRDTLRFTRWRDSLVVLRESLTVTDTLEVIRYVAAADSTIRACSLALQTCEQRVAAEREVSQALRDQIAIVKKLAHRPRLAVGAEWDPHASRWGAFVERDVGRLRLGASVVPQEQGVRSGFRAGWVF